MKDENRVYRKAPNNPSLTLSLDTSQIAIIHPDSCRYQIFKSKRLTTINQKDLTELDSLIKVAVKEYNLLQEKESQKWIDENPDLYQSKEDFIINLNKYQRQYLAVSNEKGEKEVWINCFCFKPEYWKNRIVIVDDTGNCAFNLKINLAQKKYYEFFGNGVTNL